ncbi:MAG: hypothetical protein IKY90_01060 [Oscillospiraceae bacterium]|nr:hypothetical protein [Oscillospiraceae bacterium]MBR5873305.1 hypothetical protein [Oscillospiraceae bacterium]
MRTLNRNKRQIYYALYLGETALVDERGKETGEYAQTYGDKVSLMVNISASAGEEAVNAFGGFTDYSRAITVAGQCEMDENTVIWFGVDPQTEPYNYIVTRKADSKNGVIYALQEVKVG